MLFVYYYNYCGQVVLFRNINNKLWPTFEFHNGPDDQEFLNKERASTVKFLYSKNYLFCTRDTEDDPN